MSSDGNLVGQSPRDTEQTCFFASHAGNGLFEPDGVNVFTVDSVTDRRPLKRPASSLEWEW